MNMNAKPNYLHSLYLFIRRDLGDAHCPTAYGELNIKLGVMNLACTPRDIPLPR
jgi:hypothetical protein